MSFVFAIIAIALDIVTTYEALKVGCVEGNPFINRGIKRYGFKFVIISNSACLAIITFATFVSYVNGYVPAEFCPLLAGTLHSLAAIWNLRELREPEDPLLFNEYNISVNLPHFLSSLRVKP